MNVSVLASAPSLIDLIRTRAPSLRFDYTGGLTDGDRRTGLRCDSHAARQGQVQRLAARHQARRPRRRPDARDARAQRETRPLARRRRRARLRLAGRRPGRRHREDGRDQGRPARHGRRRAGQPLLRLGPRGRQHRRAEGRLRLGGPRLRRRRRVDVARADGLRRRRLGDGPRDELRHLVRARRASAPT